VELGLFGKIIFFINANPIDNVKSTNFNPPNHLRAIHILTAFLEAAAETNQLDNSNRSIGQTYCIITTTEGLHAAAGTIACNHILIVNTLCT
jgi:hypothetical protein